VNTFKKISRAGALGLCLFLTAAAVPAAAQTSADQTMNRDRGDHDRGFDNWGLLGLLGLAGLLGRKRERNVVETRRV
jgi:MYXO-CTERM domain-containing protein